MATESRPPHPAVEPELDEMPEIEKLLRSEPASFEFFQAVRLLISRRGQPGPRMIGLAWRRILCALV